MHLDVILQLIGQYQMKALMALGKITADLTFSDVSLQFIGQYRMKALMCPRENNCRHGKITSNTGFPPAIILESNGI